MTPTTARGRQIAWYLSAELLIDEDYSSLVPQTSGEAGKHHADAFQTSLVQLLSDLTGLRAESTAIEWDPEVEALLRVHSPATVVGFWLDQESWYYGWPTLTLLTPSPRSGAMRVPCLSTRASASWPS